ncbi:upstream activation factor subunit spp27-like [Olea europaea subsp. europaea]|uniref:Upstream activation factor subunit spp27-like n=1 Tax=Olea europaea subsp. europaea TaxID=158383 RepID=A0A8S0T2M6_OLEEU|nr:upstream activation factor subunit spp27-like [Olea europaea subsp. europaea]
MAISLGVFSSFLPETLAAVSKSATETNKREPRGIMKPRRVSPEMQAFLGGVSEISRTQALKEIWAYIKQHDLQFDCSGIAGGVPIDVNLGSSLTT